MAHKAYKDDPEYKRRQRSLIPLNIVVAILSLVAAFSILFMPLLTVHIDDVSALADSMGGESAEEETDSSPLSMLEGLDFTISVTGSDLAKLGFDEDPMGVLLAPVTASLSEKSNELASRALLSMASQSMGTEVDQTSVDAVTDSLATLENAKGDEEIDAAIASVTQTLREEFASAEVDWDDAELQAQLRDMYDETVAQNGSFSTEAFICVNASQAMQGEEGSGEVYTNFSDLASGMIGEEETGESILDSVPSWVFLVISIAVLFFAAVWAILFLFAFFHIFSSNRRFTMWYVKLFGFFPCLLFGVAPLVAGALIQDAAFTAILGMVSSLSWISGACYLLLWLISIFWAFPIKRRIRRFIRDGV